MPARWPPEIPFAPADWSRCPPPSKFLRRSAAAATRPPIPPVAPLVKCGPADGSARVGTPEDGWGTSDDTLAGGGPVDAGIKSRALLSCYGGTPPNQENPDNVSGRAGS